MKFAKLDGGKIMHLIVWWFGSKLTTVEEIQKLVLNVIEKLRIKLKASLQYW